ncbi:MAG: hypothetical protein P4L69_22325 [Desulfosporosinus sp.]|nr:hypothetical protein [Desulfosporosinus sp.]
MVQPLFFISRIIKKLISSKSKGRSGDEVAEARVDYISDHLGIVKEEVIQIVSLLRDEKILADSKDLNAFIKKKDSKKNSLSILKTYGQIEKFLLTIISEEEKIIHLKELNEQAEASACEDVSPNKIKTILNLWAIKNWIKRQSTPHSKNHLAVLTLFDTETLTAKLEKRNDIAQFILAELYDLSKADSGTEESSQEEVPVAFSVLELKDKYAQRSTLFWTSTTTEEIEDALFHLSRIEALKIEGGFMVVYNALTIERLERDNKKRYKIEDYQRLEQYYQNKVQQIHIVGEYARKKMRLSLTVAIATAPREEDLTAPLKELSWI